jgi:hypothetical protein
MCTICIHSIMSFKPVLSNFVKLISLLTNLIIHGSILDHFLKKYDHYHIENFQTALTSVKAL